MTACCERSVSAGVYPGMWLAGARALLAGRHRLHAEPENPSHDRAALQGLSTWTLQFSPIVIESPPDGLLLEGSGLSRLFGSERKWMHEVVNAIRGLGIHVHAAVADTIGCAYAMARHATTDLAVVSSGREQEALSPLPIESLRVASDTAQALLEIGIDKVKHLFTIPRQELARRFGDELLLRLDQALGYALEIVPPAQETHSPHVETSFDGPVQDLEALFATVERLSSKLCSTLRENQAGVRELTLELTHADSTPTTHTFTFSYPTTDTRHLAHFLRDKIERTCLKDGIEQIGLTASAISPFIHQQREINLESRGHHKEENIAQGSSQEESRSQLGALLDTLTEQCGSDRVLTAVPVASHVPERSFRMQQPNSKSPETLTHVFSGERPSLLHDCPVLLEEPRGVIDGVPTWIRWRGIKLRIICAVGPERIGAPWWHGRSETDRCLAYRDYFKVQDECGHWLWIFHSTEADHWFVHGEWA